MFELFDEGTEILQSALNSSYLDAMLENAENIIDNNQVHVENGVPNKADQEKLQKIYRELDLGKANAEVIRQLIQLSFLKVIRKDAIQANHQMTPDTIGLIIAFLIEKITKSDKPKTVFDPAVGTANLLTTIINQLDKDEHEDIQGYGIDNDESLLGVASVNVALQHAKVDLYHQDSVSSLDIPQCDLAVSDLPIGYYPLDENARDYQTRAKEGHSYIHHLLIEQSLNYLKLGKFGVFLVPSTLFQTSEAESLIKWIHSVSYLQGFINLPSELFTNPSSQKAILILQKHGGDSKQAEKVLLGEFPSFKEKEKFANFMDEISEWVAKNIENK